jgi:hypothetical protein
MTGKVIETTDASDALAGVGDTSIEGDGEGVVELVVMFELPAGCTHEIPLTAKVSSRANPQNFRFRFIFIFLFAALTNGVLTALR